MAKLHFYYSTMNAGKSTHLLQANHNYKSDGHKTMLLKPAVDDRMGVSVIGSRIGISAEAVAVSPDVNIFELVKKEHVKTNLTALFVDEAQFFNKTQILELAKVADILDIAVLAYGLKNNFMGELFEGSKTLLELSDNLREIKTTCHCGKKATMVLKYNKEGIVQRGGAEVDIGAEEKYVAVCRKHFIEGDIGNTARKNLKKTTRIFKEQLATITSKALKVSFYDAFSMIEKEMKNTKDLKSMLILEIEKEIKSIENVKSNVSALLTVEMLEKNIRELLLLKLKIEELED